METIKSFLTVEEFIQKFKREQELVWSEPASMETWDTYSMAIRALRSGNIKWLKYQGMPGHDRSRYNDALQKIAKYSHKEYLFYKDPVCGICLKPIDKIENATMDHVYPKSLGGGNHLENKQLAHGRCNVKKSDTIPLDRVEN